MLPPFQSLSATGKGPQNGPWCLYIQYYVQGMFRKGTGEFPSVLLNATIWQEIIYQSLLMWVGFGLEEINMKSSAGLTGG